jgi:5-dehydro-2-deoxygluconokinase
VLDVVCIGRAAVDLYGEQIGGRLEDMRTFAKYIGGSPTNTAIGASRLGLRAGLVSRVGDEHNGRFVRESLQRERVDVRHLTTDPTRLTALVFLGIQDQHTFPLVFYRDHCADMSLRAEHIDERYIASAGAVLISGTHLSHPETRAACLRAIDLARRHGRRVVLDIDYRPVLWGLTAPGMGEQRYVASPEVSEQLQTVLPQCDLVVGTEEEVLIAGGCDGALEALRRIRSMSTALIVMKRGPMGCVAFSSSIPDDLEQGLVGPGFPVEVFNVLGAGDAFMAGLLRGWLRNEPLEQALRYANACGAIVVSRHGCAPAMPTWRELSHFLEHGSPHFRLREDRELERLHRVTTRPETPASLAILAFDHRVQLEELAGSGPQAAHRIARFKQLVADAAAMAYANEREAHPATSDPLPGPGVIVDDRYGADVLNGVTGKGLWIGRPVERPGSRPLEFETGAGLATALRAWPVEHVVKCLVLHHPDDPAELMAQQVAALKLLADASRDSGRELLVELIPPQSRPCDEYTVVRGVRQLYEAGVLPDWWKLPPPSPKAWVALSECIRTHDPDCRGVLLLGLEANEAQLWAAFRSARGQPLCRGFAIGRTLFGPAAQAWFSGQVEDAAVIADVAVRYRRLIRLWLAAQHSDLVAAPPAQDLPALESLT